MNISQLINTILEGQIAEGTFAGQNWFVTKSSGFIRYCNENGNDIGESVKLTPSNLRANYVLVGRLAIFR